MTEPQGPPADQGSTAPPPWQRAPAAGQAKAGAQAAETSTGTAKTFRPAPFEDEPGEPAPVAQEQEHPPGLGGLSRETVTFNSAPKPSVVAPSARRTGRGPRRAALQIKRVDPWSVLKLALVLSVALFFVWLVAVGVLYGVLQGMGVLDKLNSTYKDLVTNAEGVAEPLLSAGRVFSVAAVVGAVNIVLFTALATVSAFIYNISADLAGGVEVTLSERE